MAARTGGIQMTPERRQAYADAGLPLSTGGGFRTMPETEARRLVTHQKTGSYEGIDGYIDDPKHPLFDPRHKEEILESLHHDLDTGGSLDMDDRLIDDYHRLTEGQTLYDVLPASPEGATAAENRKRERVSNMPEIRRLPFDTRRGDTFYPNLVLNEARERALRGFNFGGEVPPPIPPQPGFDRFHAADPPRNPESEFSRRGDAGASPSDKAFRVIQQRKDNAERMKQVQADRQREMMMQRQRDRMKSRIPPQARGRRREGPNQRKMRLKREAERRKNR